MTFLSAHCVNSSCRIVSFSFKILRGNPEVSAFTFMFCLKTLKRNRILHTYVCFYNFVLIGHISTLEQTEWRKTGKMKGEPLNLIHSIATIGKKIMGEKKKKRVLKCKKK